MTTQIDRRFDFSGGIQNATTWQLRKPNEVEDAINGRFNEVIGAIVRRLGFIEEGDVLEADKSGLGIHESKWESQTSILAAINNAGDTETKIKLYNSIADTWSDLSLPGAIDPDTRMQMIDSIGETYVAGQSSNTGDRMDLLNIVKGAPPTVSSTRNLINAPAARFIAEYGGSLYAINTKVGSVVYSNRAYKSSPPMGIVTFTQGDQDVFDVLRVDSVRYIKPTMEFDLYESGVNNKLFDITATSVDKADNTLTYAGFSTATTFATTDVDTGTEIITVARDIPTGTPIKFSSDTTIPAGLVAGTIYYAINQSATTIKVATTRENATAGTAVDITSQGTGTHTITSGAYIEDNTEVWLDGRYNELCYLWNTDYPTEQTADFLSIPPGFDSDSEITGWSKTNSRLFFFTNNSTHKWDTANLITVYEDIGCPNHEVIQNIGDWVLWVDSEGRVRARNDATGQDEVISKPIKNLLKNVSTSNINEASSGRINNVYKLCLGTVDGTVLRLCYDFDSNTWEHDQYSLSMTSHVRSDMSGQMRLYFIGSDGQLYLDEEGNTDNGTSIPFIVTFGRTHSGIEQKKNYHGAYIYGQNVTGGLVKTYINGGRDQVTAGELMEQVTKVPFSGMKGQVSGRDINLVISINTDGDSPQIEALAYYFNQEEDKFGQPSQR
jgi:hypothetical protein